jgi:hypothetical protein
MISFFKLCNKGNDDDLEKEQVIKYFNNNFNIKSQKIYNLLSNNQDDPNSIFFTWKF